MTTIIAVQLDDRVVFGADNQVTAGNGRKYNHAQMAKISERGKFLTAVAGDVAARDIIQHIWTPPNQTSTDRKNLYHYVITKVIPSLKQCFKDNDYKVNNNDDDVGFMLLIAVHGEVFEIADDFSVVINDQGLYAIGSGSSFAIGALYAKATIDEALRIAEVNDVYTSGPYITTEQFKN